MKPVVRRIAHPDLNAQSANSASGLYNIGEDHRRFARRTSNLRANLEVLSTWSAKNEVGFIFDVPVNNISRNGVCFFHHQQLYPDDQVLLDFGTLRRKFQVSRCRRRGDGYYEIGAQVLAG
jgi:hypothetical protein